jgi:hypothetical protein
VRLHPALYGARLAKCHLSKNRDFDEARAIKKSR